VLKVRVLPYSREGGEMFTRNSIDAFACRSLSTDKL